MPETLQTERLTLRPYEIGDAPAVSNQIGNYSVCQWLTRVPYPYGEADAFEFFGRTTGDSFVKAVVFRGDLIGCVSIMGSDLGYWFGQTYWGRGFATEAARALLARFFDAGNGLVSSGYLRGNTASRNVLQKLGFKHTEIVPTFTKSRQSDVPNHRMELTKTRWENRV